MKKIIDSEIEKEIIELFYNGDSIYRIAEFCGITIPTVRKII